MPTARAALAVAGREHFGAADVTVRRTVFILTDVLYNMALQAAEGHT